MSAPALVYERYQGRLGEEQLMRVGRRGDPPILFVAPLFEEMNRTRALLAATMRRLAAQGFDCWLPDLSGTGESVHPLEQVTWDDWRHDVAAVGDAAAVAAGALPLVVSLRGGVLIDDACRARGWWRFAPVKGASLARDMERAARAGGAEFGGYPASPGLRAALSAAEAITVAPLRTVRLESDALPADFKLEAPALWRRSEPGTAPALTEAMATDIAAWSQACGG